MRRQIPATDWVDLGAVFGDEGIHVKGYFSYDDSGGSERIEHIRVDTGSNGFLGIALAHDLSGRVWVSEGYGERNSRALRGKNRSWRGVGTGLSIGGVFYGPVPVSISEVTEKSLVHTPLLGQDWFELANGVWIDPRGELLAVSFNSNAVDSFHAGNPEGWVSVPWRVAKPGGHRFVPVEIAGVTFEAVIDTGMDRELFVDIPHPPRFVNKPWGRARVMTPAGTVGPVWGAISNKPLQLNGFEVADLMVMWFGSRSTTLPETPDNRPFAILGLDFLRRFPVLLDPTNDRAYFFVGDRTQLDSMLSFSTPTTVPGT